MGDEKTVKVKALKAHSFEGVDHPEGTTYEVPESAVENLRNQRMAVPVEEAPADTSADVPPSPPPPKRR